MLYGEMTVGRIVLRDGRVTLEAGINVFDSQHGQIGSRLLQPESADVERHVRLFIESHLPTLSQMAGFEVRMPQPRVSAGWPLPDPITKE
jgi:hypothetical protein